MSKPIKPSEIVEAKIAVIPDVVFDVFNFLIAQKWDGRQSTINQDDVVKLIVQRSDFTRTQIFDSHMLDIEEAYRKEGWKIEYDKPGFNESYDAFFVFKK